VIPLPREDLHVGVRCQVGDDETKRGWIRFVGDTEFAPGVWVGIEYDEPRGKNDGSSVVSRGHRPFWVIVG
jgi:tubulin-specific chaperone B